MDTTEMFNLQARRDPTSGSGRVLLHGIVLALASANGLLAAIRFVLEGWGSAPGWIFSVAGLVFFGSFVAGRVAGLRVGRWVPWIGLATAFSLAAVEGGLHSEAMYWVPFTPLIAMVFAPGRSAVLVSVVSAVGVVALLGIEPSMPSGFDETPFRRLMRAGAIIGALALGMFVALAGERERLERQKRMWRRVSHHPLTGLKSRQFFMDVLQIAAERARRGGTTLALVFVDLDGLKEANDTHGHEAGDLLLQESARRIDGSTRAGDVVCHLGGDEFTIMVEPCRELSEAQTVAERIRRNIASEIEWKDGQAIQTTASVGIALHSPPESAADLVRRADRAMYQAKRAGGNQVHLDPIPAPRLRKSG